MKRVILSIVFLLSVLCNVSAYVIVNGNLTYGEVCVLPYVDQNRVVKLESRTSNSLSISWDVLPPLSNLVYYKNTVGFFNFLKSSIYCDGVLIDSVSPVIRNPYTTSTPGMLWKKTINGLKPSSSHSIYIKYTQLLDGHLNTPLYYQIYQTVTFTTKTEEPLQFKGISNVINKIGNTKIKRSAVTDSNVDYTVYSLDGVTTKSYNLKNDSITYGGFKYGDTHKFYAYNVSKTGLISDSMTCFVGFKDTVPPSFGAKKYTIFKNSAILDFKNITDNDSIKYITINVGSLINSASFNDSITDTPIGDNFIYTNNIPIYGLSNTIYVQIGNSKYTKINNLLNCGAYKVSITLTDMSGNIATRVDTVFPKPYMVNLPTITTQKTTSTNVSILHSDNQYRLANGFGLSEKSNIVYKNNICKNVLDTASIISYDTYINDSLCDRVIPYHYTVDNMGKTIKVIDGYKPTTKNIRNLKPNTNYTLIYKIRFGGSQPQVFSSVPVYFTTLADSTPPTKPIINVPTNIKTTSVDISFSSSDSIGGIKEYQIFKDGVLFAKTPDKFITLSNLVSNKIYNITVKAVDVYGNVSLTSDSYPVKSISIITDVENVENNNAIVYNIGNTIIVKLNTENVTNFIKMYNSSGELLKSLKTTENIIELESNSKGVFIVVVNNQKIKIML